MAGPGEKKERSRERERKNERTVNALIKCFLIELWKMAWKSSRIDME